MRNKTARYLRNLVADNLDHLPLTEYSDKRHEKLFFTGMTNLDGTPQYVPMEVYTRSLTESCQRRVYQRVKHYHHAYYGRS